MKFIPTLTAILMGALSMRAAEPSVAVTAINELGVELHARLAKENPNLCLSPLSIQTALAMTYAGADGQTREEMAKVLRYPADDKDGKALNDAFQKLEASLDALCKESVTRAKQMERFGGKSDPIVVSAANRLFGQKGYMFRAPFLGVPKDIYHSSLEDLDFAANPEQARQRVNGWVEDETKKRIKDLIPKNGLSPASRLVLANALYLKAPWATEFSESATKPEPFHVLGKTPVSVPTMGLKCWVRFSKEDGFTAIGIPYTGGELQFVVLLPSEPDGLPDLDKKLTPALLAKCANLPGQEVVLHLPKFKMESHSISLSAELQALGMKTAFDNPPKSANFDKMAPRRPQDYLFISDVFHKTFIAVDEHGTEAAAATAVAMAAGSAMRPNQPPVVRVDRPFVFAIQHAPSGACLFLGQVSDPR